MSNSLQQFHIDEFLLVKDSEGISERTYQGYAYNLLRFKVFLGNREFTNLAVSEYL